MFDTEYKEFLKDVLFSEVSPELLDEDKVDAVFQNSDEFITEMEDAMVRIEKTIIDFTYDNKQFRRRRGDEEKLVELRYALLDEVLFPVLRKHDVLEA